MSLIEAYVPWMLVCRDQPLGMPADDRQVVRNCERSGSERKLLSSTMNLCLAAAVFASDFGQQTNLVVNLRLGLMIHPSWMINQDKRSRDCPKHQEVTGLVDFEKEMVGSSFFFDQMEANHHTVGMDLSMMTAAACCAAAVVAVADFVAGIEADQYGASSVVAQNSFPELQRQQLAVVEVAKKLDFD